MFILCVLFLCIVLMPTINFFNVYFKSLMSSNIHFQEALEEIENGIEEQVVISILKWEKSKMINTYKTPLNFFCKTWFELMQLASNSRGIFVTRCGACGEFTHAFIELAKEKGLNVRKIENCGLDHTWVEVSIHDKWIPIETTGGKEGFNASGFYNCNWTEKLAYIYTFNNSRKIDLTKKYICVKHLGHLIIYYEPFSAIKISMPRCKDYEFITNSSGILEIDLGAGDYTLKAEKHLLFT
ncbi:MAG: hypothetical protein DRP11_03315, partial [Candidatus Aenigmatarchaeota archaeon]